MQPLEFVSTYWLRNYPEIEIDLLCIFYKQVHMSLENIPNLSMIGGISLDSL